MNKKGFTLIEILLAVAILAILSGFVMVQMNGANNAAKDAKRKADIDLIKNAVVSYRTENYSKTPVEDCAIGTCTSLPTSLQPFLATIPNDPDSSKSYRYVSDGTNCSVYATLSDGSIYRYQCQSNASSTVVPVNGNCGADGDGVGSDTFTYPQFPTNLCTQGVATSLIGSGPWNWSCLGANEGTTDYCFAKIADPFTCSLSTTCSGVDFLHIYCSGTNCAYGGHAEMNDQTAYPYKLCCVGGGVTITNITDSSSCGANQATILKLYSTTNSHVEKGTQSNYTNKICLSATGKTATCTYASSCGTGYTQLLDISDGDTSLHVGSGAFTTKVCCKVTSY